MPTVVAVAPTVSALGTCDFQANLSVIRSFLVEESKIVKNVIKAQQAKQQ